MCRADAQKCDLRHFDPTIVALLAAGFYASASRDDRMYAKYWQKSAGCACAWTAG